MISQDKKGNKLEIAEQWDTRQSRIALGLSAALNTWGQPQTVTKPCLFAYYRALKAAYSWTNCGFYHVPNMPSANKTQNVAIQSNNC